MSVLSLRILGIEVREQVFKYRFSKTGSSCYSLYIFFILIFFSRFPKMTQISAVVTQAEEAIRRVVLWPHLDLSGLALERQVHCEPAAGTICRS